MNEQLLAVKKLMDETGVRWWIDSGTLLGMVREGDILPWDNDIDIGIWASDNHVVSRTLPQSAARENHVYRLLTLRGKPFMHLLKPLPPHEGIRVTIMPYRLDDAEQAHCPVYFQKPPVHRPGSWKGKLESLRRIPLLKISRRIRRHTNGRTVLVKWPFSAIHGMTEFKVPAHFFADLKDVRGLPAPAEAEAYLAFRYGPDWRTPKRRKSEWVWHRDDGAVHHNPD